MRSTRPFLVAGIASGATALLVQFVYPLLMPVFDLTFGDSWMSGSRHALIRHGFPSDLVIGYMALLFLDLPKWALVFVLAFFMALARRPWGTFLPVCFGLSLPIMGPLSDLIFCFVLPLPPDFIQTAFRPKLILFEFVGIPVVCAGWLLARGARNWTRDKCHDTRQEVPA